ncbi:MAG: 2-amino-4-hydroxy-6-hydroxymethyldihydropteridine diphosphokinase [Planctomycetaceae bacterium]
MSVHQSSALSGVPCFVSLGGNLGDVAATMRAAVSQLECIAGIQIGALSTVYRTRPVGEHAGNRFSNAALELTTILEPRELLQQLQQVETRLGRVRERYFGPRIIDLDILFYGAQVVDQPTLRIPHPACWYRRFVLDPLSEISPSLMHPEHQLSVEQLRNQLLDRPLSVGVVGGEPRLREAVCGQLDSEYGSGRIGLFDHPAQWEATAPRIIIWLGPSETDACTVAFESLPVRQRLDATVHPCSPFQFAVDVVAAALPAGSGE